VPDFPGCLYVPSRLFFYVGFAPESWRLYLLTAAACMCVLKAHLAACGTWLACLKPMAHARLSGCSCFVWQMSSALCHHQQEPGAHLGKSSRTFRASVHCCLVNTLHKQNLMYSVHTRVSVDLSCCALEWLLLCSRATNSPPSEVWVLCHQVSRRVATAMPCSVGVSASLCVVDKQVSQPSTRPRLFRCTRCIIALCACCCLWWRHAMSCRHCVEHLVGRVSQLVMLQRNSQGCSSRPRHGAYCAPSRAHRPGSQNGHLLTPFSLHPRHSSRLRRTTVFLAGACKARVTGWDIPHSVTACVVSPEWTLPARIAHTRAA
jgi:hypothetical protein